LRLRNSKPYSLPCLGLTCGKIGIESFGELILSMEPCIMKPYYEADYDPSADLEGLYEASLASVPAEALLIKLHMKEVRLVTCQNTLF